jgi:hypothetical protein
LKDLDARRDELTLSGKQQELLLRSALEAGHETDYWFQRLLDPASALSVLTSPYLSTHAQERACSYLGVMGARAGEHSEKAKERLLQLAVSSESPSISRAASLALAPLADEGFINQHFGTGRNGLKGGEVSALAVMFDSHGLPVRGLSKTALRQMRLKILKDNSVELLFSVLRAAALGAAGFCLAATWNFAQSYIASQTRGLPVFTFLILQLSLVGLLTFIIAFPGALLAPLGRDLSALFSGGRKKLPAALGTIAGSALGTGLTVAFLSGLAEYSNPSSLRLLRYFSSGAILGVAIGLPWLLSVRLSLKPVWLVLLSALSGALVFTGIAQLENWWPATSFALSIKGQHIPGSDALAGFLIGVGSALGLAWGRLRDRSH